MGALATFVPVEVYLSTEYSPDVDYVDGEIQERNRGEQEHSTIQGFFIVFFTLRQNEWKVRVMQENRVQISATRYRIPDVCVVAEDAPFGGITRTPPLLCIEVLSPEDRMSRMQDKVHDYIRAGVQAVWIIDPYTRRASWAERSVALQPAGDVLTVDGTAIAVPVCEVFVSWIACRSGSGCGRHSRRFAGAVPQHRATEILDRSRHFAALRMLPSG